MKTKAITLFVLVAFARLLPAKTSAEITSADSTTDIFALEKKTVLQRIGFEKTRIAYDYEKTDNRFFTLVDSVSQFVIRQNVSSEKRNQYLTRLLIFLQNINRSYSESYLKSGTYFTILSYYPVLIEWDEKGELLENLKRFSSFSIKAIRLIPTDSVAESYLSDYSSNQPDDIFRFTEEFDDRTFALRILEKAVKLAPESAKRYYATENVVNDILSESESTHVKTCYAVFDSFGIKSRAYILLNQIADNIINLRTADSLGNNREAMFHYLVHLSTQNENNVTYSMFRYLDYYSADVLRKINEESLTANPSFETFSHHTPEEMFVLLSYGFKEPVFSTFRNLLQLANTKSLGAPVSHVLVSSLNQERLKELVVYCDENRALDLLLNLVDDETKEYLLGLTSLEKKEIPLPPLKSFAKEENIVRNNPVQPAAKLANAPQVVLKPIGTISLKPVAVETTKETQTKQESTLNTDTVSQKAITAEKIYRKEKVTDTISDSVPEVVEPVKIILDEKTKTVVSLKKNIFQVIQDIPSFVDKDYAESLLKYAAEKEPDELLKKIEFFKSKTYCKNILEQCALNAPVSLKRYLYNPMQPVNYTLQYSTNPVVKKIFEINPVIGYRSKPLLLLDDIVSGEIKATEAVDLSKNPDELFSAMVRIISRPKFIGAYSIDREMRDYSLRFIREINDKIASGASQPFDAVEEFSSANLYFLILYGRDEVFTSTFNGLFNRFMQRLPNNDGDAFLRSVSQNQFRDFLSLCSSFETMDEFLTRFSKDARQKILTAYISNLEAEKDDLSTIVLIAEAISNLTDKQLLTLLQTTIKKEYERVTAIKDQFGISIYGILSSMISGNAITEVTWYRKISNQFKISPVACLTHQTLFNQEKTCVEQMYFYNDDDGRGSFANFLNTYKFQPSWVIEDHKSYVRIYSRQGMRIEIFANKPEQEETGINAIATHMKEQSISPTVVIHRGHSFYTESTLEKIPASAKLIFVGSCGGFYKISMALENAPEAHIISTKQIGTKSVNDAMLFSLNENIKAGKDIIWNDFWDKMREKLSGNAYFNDYIPPNKNLESIFIRAYYKILGV